MDETGKTLLNRFRVDMLLSSGVGYARYRGFDQTRNIPVSLRIFDFIIPPDRGVLCFQQTSQTLQTLTHPNIASFFGLYQTEEKSFSAEGFVEGPSLAQILSQRDGNPMTPLEALTYLKALVSGLEYIHGFGLVHATLSPANIQATRDGAILLTNFGFSRQVESQMTNAGVYGPPLCQAPEQLRQEKIYPATDIYALGVLFYEFVTGVHPFLGRPSSVADDDPSLTATLREAHLNKKAPDVRVYNPKVPEELAETLQTALAKDYHDRYQSGQEMLEISCAVLGTGPGQVPDRIGSHAAVAATRVVPPSAAGVPPYVPSTRAAPAPAGGYAQPGGIPATQAVSGQPYAGTQAVGNDYVGAYGQPFYGTPPAEKKKKWLLPLIVGVVLLIFLCGVIGVWAGSSFLGGILGLSTETPTATLTQTPTETPLPPTPLPPTPLPPMPEMPTAEPPVVLPPTMPPPPLPPTEPPMPVPSDTPARTAFKVTIMNNSGNPIWAFRDGTLMGTDPIPPGKYIWYLNIPAGPHQFVFCLDMGGNQCPYGKQVNVKGDVTVNVK